MDFKSVALRVSVVLHLGDDTRLTGHRNFFLKGTEAIWDGQTESVISLRSVSCTPADFSMLKKQRPILCLCIGTAVVFYKSDSPARCRSPPTFNFFSHFRKIGG